MDKISTKIPENGHNFGRRPSFSVKIGANDCPECVQSGCRQTLFMNSEFEGSPDPNPMARKKNMVVFWSILEKWGLPGKRGLWQCLGPGPKKNRKKVPQVDSIWKEVAHTVRLHLFSGQTLEGIRTSAGFSARFPKKPGNTPPPSPTPIWPSDRGGGG